MQLNKYTFVMLKYALKEEKIIDRQLKSQMNPMRIDVTMFSNAHMCIKIEELIDRQLNKNLNISFNQKMKQKIRQTKIIIIRTLPAKLLLKVFSLWSIWLLSFDYSPLTNVLC